MLPGVPHIFHGRESELRDVVHGLTQDIARVAILGPGGIGKTALAKSALHHPDIIDKYPVRYFVSCDSAGTIEDLIFAVAIALGLEPAEALSKAIIKHLAAQSSCLVILDNLETPWERIETRPKVEEFLARLGDLSHVALLVSLSQSSVAFRRLFSDNYERAGAAFEDSLDSPIHTCIKPPEFRCGLSNLYGHHRR